MQGSLELAQAVDRSTHARLLVFGSLPPYGHDLDVLVPDRERPLIVRHLEGEGFRQRHGKVARFRECSAQVVDLVPASSWRLPTGELEMLYSEAKPILGFANLIRPSPRHVLLILARRLAGSGTLSVKAGARLEEALTEDPEAWRQARDHADAWGAIRALVSLRRAHGEGRMPSRAVRIMAITEARRAGGRGLVRGSVGATRAVWGRRPRGAVVTFSGLDGSGKTTQAWALHDALRSLGHDVAVEWTRLTFNPSLDLLAMPVKRLLARARRARRLSGTDAGRDAAGEVTVGPSFRRRNPLVDWTWVTIVAAANAASQRRATRGHVRRGRIVICDRYTLDSAAHLRFRYGPERSLRFQSRLIRLVSPRPLRSYFLDVPAPTAYARKTERYSVEDLALLAQLYREERAWLRIEHLDGERPRAELCTEIAEDVWGALSDERKR